MRNRPRQFLNHCCLDVLLIRKSKLAELLDRAAVITVLTLAHHHVYRKALRGLAEASLTRRCYNQDYFRMAEV